MLLKKTLKGGFVPPALSTLSQFELLSVLGGPGAQAARDCCRLGASRRRRCQWHGQRATPFPRVGVPAAGAAGGAPPPRALAQTRKRVCGDARKTGPRVTGPETICIGVAPEHSEHVPVLF